MPRAPLRPACHPERAVPQRIGDRRQVVGPAGIGASLLRTRLSHAGRSTQTKRNRFFKAGPQEFVPRDGCSGRRGLWDDQRSARLADRGKRVCGRPG